MGGDGAGPKRSYRRRDGIVTVQQMMGNTRKRRLDTVASLAARLSWVGVSAAAVDSISAAVIFKVHHRPTLHHHQLFVLRPCSIGMAMRVASAFRRALAGWMPFGHQPRWRRRNDRSQTPLAEAWRVSFSQGKGIESGLTMATRHLRKRSSSRFSHEERAMEERMSLQCRNLRTR